MIAYNNIKDIRKKTGMTQKQFANEIGIPKRTIENWESNKRKCPEYTRYLIEYYVNTYILK